MAQYYRFNKEGSSRRPGTMSLKDAFDQMINAYKLNQTYNESYLEAHWEKIMGASIASRTTKVYVKDKVLYLQIESAPLRGELVRAKAKIIELINREMNVDLIGEVVFI
jgi:predicted nucleic acid-binding Zn ribbon protein